MPQQKSNAPPKAKTPPLQQRLLDDARQFGAQLFQRLFGLAQGWEKHRDIVQNNYELGCKHLALGNIRDAILRFKMVTWLAPKHADGWCQLGRAYVADGRLDLARSALARSLKLRPGNEEAAYALAIASGGKMPKEALPKKMPLALVRQHFDPLAADFTQTQLNTYHYQGHQLLANAVRAALPQGRIDHVILELGPGTGLCGARLRDVASQLTGVDISGAMLDEAMKLQDAAGRKIYDALIRREMHDFLREAIGESYDIVLAAGVFSYVGDLAEIFAQAARVLKSGGIFAFTADKMEGEGFRLDAAAGRFLFSKPYLEAQAAANGFKITRFEEVLLYPDYGGWLCVFARG